MSTNNDEPEVKIIERSEVAPAEGDDVDEDENETQPDPSQEENDDKGEEKPESEETEETAEETTTDEAETEETTPAADLTPKTEKYGDIKRLPNESAREFALRLEVTKLRGQIRGERAGEILTAPPTPTKKEMSPEKKKVLEQYKPEDISKLKEVFDVLADDMGFARKDELNATTFQKESGEVLDSFLENHPEYLPENDKNSALWNRFKEEYGIYRPAQNTRELKKILEKVHKEVFGIKPAAAITKNDAAKEKIKVASHSGASRPAPSREGVKRGASASQGLRLDMLKGFSDDEIADLGAE
ncbi:MAG: hypothetical protein V4481_05340 [Patescibacteria group bacterium]